MGYGLTEQPEPEFYRACIVEQGTPWKKRSRSGFNYWSKRFKNRGERRRAKSNPECLARYGKHRGWEW